MKKLLLLLILGVCSAQNLQAATKADSIVAFTGARTKLVWKRMPWCNDNYIPQSQAYMSANQSLMFFDTDVGVERTLDKSLADIQFMRISRSGKWATWNDTKNSITYSIDLTAASPVKKILLSKSSCSYWCVRAFWIDPSTGIEYLFCLDNYDATKFQGNGIYKVPLNVDGTADVSKSIKISYGNGFIDDAIAVSQDGKKLGGAFPWPNTKILDIATGSLLDRHDGQFGCQANLAPDNSYRFFHCLDQHEGVQMFDAGLSATHWPVDFLATAPSWTCKEGNTDFAAPRWTNNISFISNTYPLGTTYLDGDCPCWANLNIFSLTSAADVKSKVRQDLISNFFIAKFATDFKTISKTLMIASDLRYFQYGGDAWLCNGVVAPGTSCPSVAIEPTVAKTIVQSEIAVNRTGSLVLLSGRNNENITIIATDVFGRVVYQKSATGLVSIDTKSFGSGVYVISVKSSEGSFIQKLTISK